MKKFLLVFIIMILGLLKIDLVCAEVIYKEYKIGDKITYNGIDFYVIEDSGKDKNYVTLLKAKPLTVDEVNKYGIDKNGLNRVNRNTYDYIGRASNIHNTGYGGMAYYTSETCGYVNGDYVTTSCDYIDYEYSDVKVVVDNWALDTINTNDLITDSTGYKARLMTHDILINKYNYKLLNENLYGPSSSDYESWLCKDNEISYWLMNQNKQSSSYLRVWTLDSGPYCQLSDYHKLRDNIDVAVRPVINLKKEPLGTKKKLTDKEFEIGDIVEYNNMLFYVIKNSTKKDDSVTLLKAEPLTVAEVNKYGGVGTDNNHVNMYIYKTSSFYQTAYDYNGYGGMAYYTSETCGYVNDFDVNTGCTTDYNSSEIKYVVDAWADDKINKLDLKEDSLGYKTRLLTLEDLTNNLGYENNITCTGGCFYTGSMKNVPTWIYNSNYSYWTMSPNEDSAYGVLKINSNGGFNSIQCYEMDVVVRPVITLKKTDYDVVNDKVEESEEIEESIDDNQIIKVPDTLLNNKIILSVIGIILIITSVVIIVLIKRRKNFKRN